MSTTSSTTSSTTPDVERFVAAVRAHFADLGPEEREDLLDGLEADTADLVAERGTQALGDPAAYAAELRAAAGLPAHASRRRTPAVGPRVAGWLDGARDRWESTVHGLPGDPWGVLVSLRPVWWVLRAWVALQAVDLVLGRGSYNWGLSPVPSLLDYGAPLLVVAVVVSVQIGRGRIWPGTPGRGTAARVLLLGLNVLALALVPVTTTSVLTPEKASAWTADTVRDEAPAVDPGVIIYQGREVCRLRVVDEEGRRVEGLRVLDATSRVFLPMNTPGC